MHLESTETDINPAKPYPAKPPIPPHSDQPAPDREGLPAAFKMRRERHYVEQLMGDAPLRTIREIPLSQIEPPVEETGDLHALQQSIKEIGILQPLLVGETRAASAQNTAGGIEEGVRFTIIAGANRYRAAVELGLRTVPCVVCETESHTVDALREAARRRAANPIARELPMPTLTDESRQSPAAEGLREVTARLAFVSAVMPALDAAGYDPLRWNILTDLLKVEMERARSIAAAIEWLSCETGKPARESVDAGAIVDAVLEAVAPEARLQSIKLEVESNVAGYRIALDRAMIVRAIIGMIQGMLAGSASGSTLRLEFSGTAVRPALIVSVTQRDWQRDTAAAELFFDSTLTPHAAGVSDALVLGGVSQVARWHGGRVHARAGAGALTATFVVPRLLEDV